MRRLSSAFISLWLICCLQAPLTFADLAVAPGDPHIQYVGRFTDDYRFGWTGSTIRIKFEGTSAAALLSPRKTNALQVIVDGQPTQTLIITQDQTRYMLASDLPAGEHTLELFHRTEGSFHEVKFNGFELSDGAKLLDPPQAERRILVFGDSITCGYANEEPDRSKGNSVSNENGYMSYAAITARHFNADVQMICWSGRGIFRNRNTTGDDKQGVMPHYLRRTLPFDKTDSFDPRRFVPQIIVINLGTNDLNTGKNEKPALDKDDYLGAYRKFIDELHRLYPEAQIIASIGPMAHSPITDWLPELETQYPFVKALIFGKYTGDPEIGGHWHPSVKGGQRMAEELTAKIKTMTQW